MHGSRSACALAFVARGAVLLGSVLPGQHAPAAPRPRPGVAVPAAATEATEATPPAAPADPRTPNVLLLVADDLGPEYVACYQRNPDPPATPALDQLARRGVRFDRAYADPICSPSRACLQTGRYAFRSGVVTICWPGKPGLRDEELLLPEALADSGYARAMIGKWHLGALHGPATPNVQGWPTFIGGMEGSVRNYVHWEKVDNGVVSTCTRYATTDEVDEALAWIHAQRQPWLLLLCFHAPHSPYHAPPPQLHHQELRGLVPRITPVPFYKAMIEALDHEVGRLLRGLGPQLANTDVLFLGDNGTPGEVALPGVSSMRAKGSLYEPGTRIAFLASGPDVAGRGRVCAQPVSILDVMPTVLEICGVDAAREFPHLHFDGTSLLPLLRNAGPWSRPALYTEVVGTQYGNGYSLLRGRYKLIRFTDAKHYSPHEELYDLMADPQEQHDLLLGPPAPPVAAIRDLYADSLWRLRHEGFVLEFGDACGSACGAFRPRSFGPPRLGEWFPFTLMLAPEDRAPLPSMTLLGWSRTAADGARLPRGLDLDGLPGCHQYVSADVVFGAGATGSIGWIRIPYRPELLRADFYLQGFALDPAPAALAVAGSSAFRVVIGE